MPTSRNRTQGSIRIFSRGENMDIILIDLIFINIFTVYKCLYKSIFNNNNEFKKAVRYSFTPDLISLFRGEFWEDKSKELKVGMFILLCIVITVLEYAVVSSVLRWINL